MAGSDDFPEKKGVSPMILIILGTGELQGKTGATRIFYRSRCACLTCSDKQERRKTGENEDN